MTPKRIVEISVIRMDESCQRSNFYVRVKTDEGFTMEVVGHRSAGVYENFVGLTVDEARERTLIEAATWSDFLQIPCQPYSEDGVEFKPSFMFKRYETRRILKERND